MGEFWKTWPMWAGEAVVIVGGGPSLDLKQVRLIGIAKAQGLARVIAVNDAAYPCWFADIAYACDARWWRHHRGLDGFAGIKVSCDDSRVPGVRWLRNTGKDGFDPTPGSFRTGSNSGYQAMHLAAHLGVRKIILAGFDMTDEPKVHWFGEHPPELRCSARTMEHRLAAFATLKPELEKRGIAVVNTSPKTALKFRRGDLFQELELERAHASSQNDKAA